MSDREEALSGLRRAVEQLRSLAERIASDTAAKREDVDDAVAAIVRAQRQLFGSRPRAKKGEGGRHRILEYLKAHVGAEVAGEELQAVSGIGEWARRTRELRVQFGYDITELGNSIYRLESLEPDQGRAAEWKLLNSIRRTKGSAQSRLMRLFETHVGKVVSGEQIMYAAKIPSAARRVRELRDEHGWPINSHIDEPELKSGEYRLVSADPADRHDTRQRLYEEQTRESVFKRDNYTCQTCGRDREAALKAGDMRFYLELHHKTAVAEELDALPPEELNREENLVTLCHADHLKETASFQERRRQERRSN